MEHKIKDIVWISVDELLTYPNNAKKHDAQQIERMKKSIEQFGFNDPIAIDKNNVIIEGHGRLIASKELGIDMLPCIYLDHLNEEEVKAYRNVHNKLNMDTGFDYDMLAMDLGDITNIDMSEFGFDLSDEFEKYEYEIEPNSLVDDFIVPPFSVLDTRQGYWKTRKKQWLEKTGNLSETRDGEFGTISNGREKNMLARINGGTSNFDPVLAETMMKWFCIEGGHVLDPFGGEQTKGVVAGECGYKYTGVEIRQEQVDTNNKAIAKYKNIKYICGDSNDISKLIPERDFDFCFTSPPYYDLEIYSKNDMSALGTYAEFMAQYYNIFQQCYDMLAADTFICVKVGEIRDKKTGIYRNFVGDTVTTLTRCGFKYYNEIILVTPAGTLPLRVGQSMRTRKVGKMHQNVLVFYKGDPKNIADKYPQLNFDSLKEQAVEDEDEMPAME